MLQSAGLPAPAFYDRSRAQRPRNGGVNAAGSAGPKPGSDASLRRARLHAAHFREAEQIKAGLAGLLLFCAGHSGGGLPLADMRRTAQAAARQPDSVLSAFGARPLQIFEAPDLYAVLLVICRRAGLRRVPGLYLLPFVGMNAYALGNPENACISVTEDLLRGLSRHEVAGIFAHEVAHILHGDDHAMNWAASVQQAIVDLALRRAGEESPRALLLSAAPLLARLLTSALSRVRELAADLRALDLIEDPGALADALCKLELFHTGRRPAPAPGGAHPALALNSHPETWERIARLC